VSPDGHWISPHAQDPDMPRRDASGEGLCLNCHDPHGTVGTRDLLVLAYGGIGGHGAAGPPAEYRLCFSCHGADGSAGIDPENRLVEDWYDAGLNGDRAGHAIRKNPAVALSWPAHVQVGDRLPCYDCHGPHGSRGNDGVRPNAYLISDERPGWSGLLDTRNDPDQARRFCLGCHIPSDGIPGSQSVEGIVMNTLSVREAHGTSSTGSCYDCHGRDTTSPTGNNVHNPASGSP
jgi:cytochrome c553